MSVTIVVPETHHGRVDIGVSALGELTALLHAAAGSGHHPVGPVLERARDEMAPSLWREINRFSILWSGYRARCLLPGRNGTGRGFDADLADLCTCPDGQFLEAAAWAVRGGHSGSPSRAELLQSAAAQAAVLERAKARGSGAFEVACQLFDDPAQFRARLVQLLHDVFETFFVRELANVTPELQADVATRRHLLETAGVASAIASLSPATQVLARPLRVRIDKVHHGYVRLERTTLLLIPSVFGRPHLLTKHEPGWPPLIQYPIGNLPKERSHIPLDGVRSRLDALTDPTRLGLCRLVAREPASTSDLAARTGMSAPQVSRHLRRLREAGVVHTHREGRNVLYRLDLDGIRLLGNDLLTALLR